MLDPSPSLKEGEDGKGTGPCAPFVSCGLTRAQYGWGLPYPRRHLRKCGDGKPSPDSGPFGYGLVA